MNKPCPLFRAHYYNDMMARSSPVAARRHHATLCKVLVAIFGSFQPRDASHSQGPHGSVVIWAILPPSSAWTVSHGLITSPLCDFISYDVSCCAFSHGTHIRLGSGHEPDTDIGRGTVMR